MNHEIDDLSASDLMNFMESSENKISVNEKNWADFPFSPDTLVTAIHRNQILYLYFEVFNERIRVTHTSDQSPVYEDSCVEMFIQPDSEKYFNLEFNALGVALCKSGTNRHDRINLSPGYTQRIDRFSKIQKAGDVNTGTFNWSLLVKIPFDVIQIEAGKSYRANFQKCGDLTPDPHFASWNPIRTSKPDFHQKDFFGEVRIEKS